MSQDIMKITSTFGEIEFTLEDDLFTLLEENRTKFRFVYHILVSPSGIASNFFFFFLL